MEKRKVIMRILIACEYSQIVAKAFINKGHSVLSCDLSPGDKGLPHYQGDLKDVLHQKWDMIIAFPPCTYLCKAQMWRCNKDAERAKKRDMALEFVQHIWAAACPKIIIENPVGYLNKNWMSPGQIISPHLFGSHYKKDICLWLKGVPRIKVDKSRIYKSKYKRVSNHVNSRMSQEQKSKIKSKFFPEVAEAMAEQWG